MGKKKWFFKKKKKKKKRERINKINDIKIKLIKLSFYQQNYFKKVIFS